MHSWKQNFALIYLAQLQNRDFTQSHFSHGAIFHLSAAKPKLINSRMLILVHPCDANWARHCHHYHHLPNCTTLARIFHYFSCTSCAAAARVEDPSPAATGYNSKATPARPTTVSMCTVLVLHLAACFVAGMGFSRKKLFPHFHIITNLRRSGLWKVRSPWRCMSRRVLINLSWPPTCSIPLWWTVEALCRCRLKLFRSLTTRRGARPLLFPQTKERAGKSCCFQCSDYFSLWCEGFVFCFAPFFVLYFLLHPFSNQHSVRMGFKCIHRRMGRGWAFNERRCVYVCVCGLMENCNHMLSNLPQVLPL